MPTKPQTTKEYLPPIYMPDIHPDGKPFRLSNEDAVDIGEYGGIEIDDKAKECLEKIATHYIQETVKLSNPIRYSDIRNHGKKVSKKARELLDLIEADKGINKHFKGFIEETAGFWSKDLHFQKLEKKLHVLITATNSLTHTKAVRDKNHPFIDFIHMLSKIYLKLGGSKKEFPSGASKLLDKNNHHGKEYSSLFVDFVEETIKKLNTTLAEDRELASQVYDEDNFKKLLDWFDPIETYEYQTLAKKIQRALADKPLHVFEDVCPL